MPKKTVTKVEWKEHKVWQKLLYPFRIPKGLDDDDRHIFNEIYIDVTSSAPSFDSPEAALSNVFEEVLKEFPKRKKLKFLILGQEN